MMWRSTSLATATGTATVLLGAAATMPAALAQDASQVVQPDGVALYADAPREDLVARGEELFGDADLGPTDATCAGCHAGMQRFNDTFKEPYPHPVAMASNMFGVEEVNAAEMVQMCMVVPMGADPLDWQSEELAALAAYVEVLRTEFAAR
jgi:hypothetical protein